MRAILRLAFRSHDLRTEQNLPQRLPELKSMPKFPAEPTIPEVGTPRSFATDVASCWRSYHQRFVVRERQLEIVAPCRAQRRIQPSPCGPRIRRRRIGRTRGRQRVPLIAHAARPPADTRVRWRGVRGAPWSQTRTLSQCLNPRILGPRPRRWTVSSGPIGTTGERERALRGWVGIAVRWPDGRPRAFRSLGNITHPTPEWASLAPPACCLGGLRLSLRANLCSSFCLGQISSVGHGRCDVVADLTCHSDNPWRNHSNGLYQAATMNVLCQTVHSPCCMSDKWKWRPCSSMTDCASGRTLDSRLSSGCSLVNWEGFGRRHDADPWVHFSS